MCRGLSLSALHALKADRAAYAADAQQRFSGGGFLVARPTQSAHTGRVATGAADRPLELGAMRRRRGKQRRAQLVRDGPQPARAGEATPASRIAPHGPGAVATTPTGAREARPPKLCYICLDPGHLAKGRP